MLGSKNYLNTLRIDFNHQTIMKNLLFLLTLIFLIGCGGDKDSSKQSEEKKVVAPKKTANQGRVELIEPIPTEPDYVYEIIGNKAVITKYNGSAESLTIPDTIEDVPVTEIRAKAFAGSTTLKSIIIGDNVTVIGRWAFSGCTGLYSIEIPSGVTSIGELAFDNCTNLDSINVGDDNQYYSSEDGVLYDNGKTKIIQCPLGKSGSLTVAKGVSSIDSYAFRSCGKITSVVFGNDIKSIGVGAFYNCVGLNAVTLPESISSIGDMAFYKCTNLSSIAIPANITTIGVQMFGNCSSLRQVNIPEGVISISKGAFFECADLSKITIPSSVRSLGRGAFSRCENLESVTFLGDAPSASPDSFGGSEPTIYFSSGTQGWADTFAGLTAEAVSSE
jgi:hypothetical protein